MQSAFIQDILVPAGMIGTLLGTLIGLPFGIRARRKAKHATGETARFLRLLSHHILEPSITIGSALLAALFSSRINETLYAFVFPLVLVSLISFLGLFTPLFFWKWESHTLRRHNNRLKGWGLARFGTCISTWLAGFAIEGTTVPKDAVFASGVYLAGMVVLWVSIIRGARLLNTFPHIHHPASTALPLPEGS